MLGRETLQVGPYEVAMTRKRIKRAWLRVDTPEGPVRVSAPERMSAARIEAFVLGRTAWIEQRRAELASVGAGLHAGHVLDDGRVLLWGEPRPLADVLALAAEERARAAGTRPRTSRHDLSDPVACERAAVAALRVLLLAQARPLMAQWEGRMDVRVSDLSVRDMSSRWGSCSTRSGRVRLSLRLAHYPPACLELIVVHELTHLLEASHNARFHALMSEFLPDWPERERTLRRLSQGR